jgi:hypothetical protein
VDQLERDLRAALADDRLSLPVRPDASGLISAGVRRRRRNRLVASVASVVVLVGGAGVAVATIGNGGGTERVAPPANVTPSPTTAQKPPRPGATSDEVPWAATAYDYHHPPAFPGAVADPSVPWCRAAQLSLSQAFQGATGNWFGGVQVRNASSTTCALQGQPAVRIEAADGRTLVSSTPEPFYVDQWVRLAPGDSAGAGVQWMQEFCHEPAPARIAVALPHNGGSLSTAMSGAPRCNLQSDPPSAGQLDVDGFLSTQDRPFTPVAGLLASVDHVSAAAIAGGVVTYRLQLQSMSTHDVALSPCLPYRERLVNTRTGHVIEEDHLLNCAAAPATMGDPMSNRATYFDMQIAVPPDAPAGSYALVWQSVLKPVNAVADNDVRIGTAAPACTDGQITATDGGRGQAMSQYGHVIVLHNVSSSACSLRGYPGVELVDSTGQPIGKPATRAGGYVFSDPGPSTIVLAAGTGVASFTFGGEAYDNARQQACPSSAAAFVYPPGLRHRLRVAMSEPYCPGGITTAAIVAGTKGSTF